MDFNRLNIELYQGNHLGNPFVNEALKKSEEDIMPIVFERYTPIIFAFSEEGPKLTPRKVNEYTGCDLERTKFWLDAIVRAGYMKKEKRSYVMLEEGMKEFCSEILGKDLAEVLEIRG